MNKLPPLSLHRTVCSLGHPLRHSEWKHFPVTCYGEKCWNENCIVLERKEVKDEAKCAEPI